MPHHSWRVLLLDTKRENPNHYICLAIRDALESHPDVEAVFKAELGSAVATARKNDCNLFIAFDGEQLSADICARLASICGRSVLWVTEDPYESPVNRQNAKLFDLVFTNDSGSVKHYGIKGIHLPFAGSQKLHFHPAVEADSAFMYDLLFVGTAWPNRVKLFQQILKEIPGLRLKIALPGNEHLPTVELPLPASSFTWRVPNNEFARLANRSRIVLTLHRDFSSSGGKSSANTPGPRLFEVALAGGFQLVDNSLPEIHDYFQNDEIATFDTPQTCIKQIKHYLGSSKDRIAMTNRSQQRALREHCYEHRITKIIDACNEINSPQPAIATATPKRPRILMVTHNIVGKPPFGGVEIYQDILRNGLANEFEFLFYVPDRHSNWQETVLLDNKLNEIQRFKFSAPINDIFLSCPEREKAFEKVLIEHHILAVHFQHLIGHVPSLPFISKALGIGSVFSAHDYYAACKNFNLIGYQGQYCDLTKQSDSRCDVCLNAMDNARPGSQAGRRSFFARMLKQIEIIHCNTEGVANLLIGAIPTLENHHGIRVKGIPTAEDSTTTGSTTSQRLRIAILGNFSHIKGADTLIHALNLLREDPIDFTLFGRVDPPYDQTVKVLNLTNLHVYGAYDPGSIDDELASNDVSLHVSIWPETYCLTLSEAWQRGLVPVVSDIGALGERVIHGKNGLKISPNDPGQLADTLRLLSSDRNFLMQLKKGAKEVSHIKITDHLQFMREIYVSLSDLTPQRNIAPEVPNNITLADCGIYLNSPIWLNKPYSRHIPIATQCKPNLAARAFGYLKTYGIGPTAKRALISIKYRVGIRSK